MNSTIKAVTDAHFIQSSSECVRSLISKLYNNCTSSRRQTVMDKLAEAKSLSTKADHFMGEGNYDYAIRCYDKIVLLLKSALTQATSIESIQAIKQKITKFLQLKMIATATLGQKEAEKHKVVKFGFPDRNHNIQTLDTYSLKRNKEPLENNPQGLHRQFSVKGVFQRHKQKVELDPAIDDLIVRKLDVSFKDIVGLKEVKAALEEAVIRPQQRPDLYTGIRAPPKGLLLYGPPGNGKTYICKALAKESGCTFFALSASSILNKLVGQSQKMIKRVFSAAEQVGPSIIFIDEIDSMLTARSENENEAARRLKTEFLVLMDGVNSPKSGSVLVIGATNLPKELDSAAKRRFSKMIYIGHPDSQSRKELLQRNLKEIQVDLSSSDINKIVDKLQYFSASEIRSIIAQTCMIPLRELQYQRFSKIHQSQLRKVNFKDFCFVMKDRKPIVSKEELAKYKEKV